MECIFCKIIDGQMPSKTVYEDNDFLAFLDINPSNKGHTLVIPKKHFETFNELPKFIIDRYMQVLQKVSLAVVRGTDAKGYNIFVNNNKVAGQEVGHVHFHILPRDEQDNNKFYFDHKKYEDGEIEEYMEKIRQHL